MAADESVSPCIMVERHVYESMQKRIATVQQLQQRNDRLLALLKDFRRFAHVYVGPKIDPIKRKADAIIAESEKQS